MFKSIYNPMNICDIDIFDWLVHNHKKAQYIMAFSNSFDFSYDEYQKITNFNLPSDVLLNYNNSTYAEHLKQVFADYYKCKNENVVLTCGGTESNFLVFQSLLSKDDEVIVEQPGYGPLWLTPKMLGARISFFTRSFEQQFKLDASVFENLLTKKTKLVVLTNLHNPSGIYVKKEEMKEIADIAQDHGVFILIDEIFLDGCFHTFESSYGLPNVIVTSSVTKIYGLGGLRFGWIVAPKNIALKCNKLKSHTNSLISEVSLLMVLQGFMKGKEALRNRFITSAKTNMAIVDKWIQQNNHLVEYVKPSGGIICFPKYKSSISSRDLCQQLLNEYNVLVNPGQLFNYEGHFRLSCNIDEDLLKEGLTILRDGLEVLL
jgi:aspartate/methionine/tyrosine aminotransferase